jgi:SAM-dependent methyltransferase
VSLYERIAEDYDELQAAALVRAARYVSELTRALDAAGHAVDLGCGTGHTCRLLHDSGWTVTGVDRSAAMLAQARRRAAPGCDFLEADIENLAVPPTADGVVCFGDTLNHLVSDGAWQRTFGWARKVLADGGVLAFDVVTPHDHQDVWPHWLEVSELSGLSLIVRGDPSSNPRRARLLHTGFVEDRSSGLWTRFEEAVEHVSHDAETVVAWLSEAGFEDVSYRDGDTLEDATPESTRWFFLARLPRKAGAGLPRHRGE